MEYNIKITVLLLFIASSLYAQRDEVSPTYIRTQIGISLAEHERQVEIKQHTGISVVLENQNTTEQRKWRETYDEMLQRLSWVEFGLSTLPVAWRINQYTEQTREGVQAIYRLLESHPELLISIPTLNSIVTLIEEIEMNTRLLIGVVVGASDIFQMEIVDRKRMIGYVVDEFRYLRNQTWNVRRILNTAMQSRRRRSNHLRDYINKDKRKFERVIQGIIG